MFKCDICGECCRHVNDSDIYKDLDRGDGICKYLQDSRCSIYESRPLYCRIDDSFNQIFKPYISLEDYYALNYDACNKYKSLIKK